jgi:hypothetical protein
MLCACSSAAVTVPTEEVRELCKPLKVGGSTTTPQVPVHILLISVMSFTGRWISAIRTTGKLEHQCNLK